MIILTNAIYLNNPNTNTVSANVSLFITVSRHDYSTD